SLPSAPNPPRVNASSQSASAPSSITLDDALHFAVQHNHALLALRSTILQSQAQEVTANLRPNPVLAWDAQFLPIFQPDQFSGDYLDNNAQFDAGVSYLFERGKKRQHRLQAAKDATAVVRSQVSDSERQLIFNVAQQFINVLLAESTLAFAQQDLDSFQKTVDISESRFHAGDMSEGDLLKIKLQLLQFQSDVSAAKLARVQALAGLRQFLGFESVADDYDVSGDLDYQTVKATLADLKTMAAQSRPDLVAAQQGVTAARSQLALAEVNGKQDLTAGMNYTHTAGVSSAAFAFNIPLAVFDRNQGEIARTRYAITQAQEQLSETAQQVSTDVVDAYENLRTNDQIIQLYRGGYVDQAKQSRDISEYAYRRGAASLLDYLDSERTYRANQLAYRQALASYMLAIEQLRQAVGTRNLP
ncbi:MAG TPA: TolC family protein, partial [Candidatus Acidoferrum sp.]|nr:TolC family protein [Candidatus Acidoferrum sp.]